MMMQSLDARVLITPTIEFGTFQSTNYYATSSPNIDVGAMTYGISNGLSMYVTPWLNADLSLGYDEERTSTILENNRSAYGSFMASFFPTINTQWDTLFNAYGYRSDRYDSGNLNLFRVSQSMATYFDDHQYVSISVSYNDYDYVKTDVVANKTVATIGYQSPWNVYFSYGHGVFSSSNDASDYTEHMLGLRAHAWMFYPWGINGRVSYSVRDYESGPERGITALLGLGRNLNDHWRVSSSVSYDSNVDRLSEHGLQFNVSVMVFGTFNRSFELTDASRTTFLYKDALGAIDNENMDEASILLDRIIFFHPTHVEALFERGFIAHKDQDYERSTDLFHRVIRLDPTFSEAYYLLAYGFIKLGKTKKANAILSQLN